MSAKAVGRARWIVIDSVDPDALVPFWCGLFGVERAGTFGEDYVMLTHGDGTVPPIAFQRVPETKTGKNRVHLDVTVDDVEAAARRVAELGGSRVGGLREMNGYRWQVMADPEGNEFCLVPD
jgi:predicted enzyme related to lactoylglutathione lyase